MNIDTGKAYRPSEYEKLSEAERDRVRLLPRWLRDLVTKEADANDGKVDLTADTPQAEWARRRVAAADEKRRRKAAKRLAARVINDYADINGQEPEQ